MDPLTAKYPWNSPYAFSENKLISAIELEGLEAWEITKDWSEVTMAHFGEFVNAELSELNQIAMTKDFSQLTSKESFDCADLIVNMLVKFASREGLHLKLSTWYGEIDSNDPKYTIGETDLFLEDARNSVGQEHLIKDFVPIFPDQALTGDADFSVLGHVSLVREFSVDPDADRRRRNNGYTLIVSGDQSGFPGTEIDNSTPMYDSRFVSSSGSDFRRFKMFGTPKMEIITPKQPAEIRSEISKELLE